MNNFIKKRFALSELGAKNFCKGMYWTVALDIVLMLPYLYFYFSTIGYTRYSTLERLHYTESGTTVCSDFLFLPSCTLQPYFNTAVHT